jgi:(p)ppGpp synthase/HD superfamily hydrolase
MSATPEGVDTARAFAIRAHGDQLYGDLPYVTHLDAVVALLRQHGHEEVIPAGYLHDVLEDTSVSFEELEAAFGSKVAHAVAFCSDEAGADRKARKTATYARMKEQLASGADWLPLGVCAKVADRLANTVACVNNNERLLSVYRDEYATFRAALHRPGMCDSMWAALEDASVP